MLHYLVLSLWKTWNRKVWKHPYYVLMWYRSRYFITSSPRQDLLGLQTECITKHISQWSKAVAVFILYACSVRYSYSAPNRTPELNPPLKSIQQRQKLRHHLVSFTKWKIWKWEKNYKVVLTWFVFTYSYLATAGVFTVLFKKQTKKSLNSPTLNYVHLLLHWSVGCT